LYQGEHFVDARGTGIPGQLAESKSDIFGDGKMGEQGRSLWNQLDALCDACSWNILEQPSVELNADSLAAIQSGDQTKKSTFSGAGGSEEHGRPA
jgi:hypothetical protein